MKEPTKQWTYSATQPRDSTTASACPPPKQQVGFWSVTAHAELFCCPGCISCWNHAATHPEPQLTPEIQKAPNHMVQREPRASQAALLPAARKRERERESIRPPSLQLSMTWYGIKHHLWLVLGHLFWQCKNWPYLGRPSTMTKKEEIVLRWCQVHCNFTIT